MPFPPLLPLAGPVPPLVPVPVPVVEEVVPPSPTPPLVVEVVPVLGGVVAVVVVVDVVVGVVELVEVVGVVVDDVDDEVLLEDAVVGVEMVVDACWRHSFAASWEMVTAPWVRFARSVGLTVIGSFWTSVFSAALALTAAPQSPDCTAELISLP
ncbi:MAG: hypothetical protein WAN22_33020 [Solirubrobacteraceae bacterium]